jgi:threonylcarbamoyladenosine tRNA methylthiotransferase MtaB
MHPAKSDDTIQVITLGCRLNTFESEVMREHARTNQLSNTIIINTCAVTNEAERQSRQAIRRARKENPSARIIVTGCSAQMNPDVYASMPEVDRILGNHEKMQAESFSQLTTERVRVNDIMEIKETAHHLISGFEGRVRAFIQIQNGCDHRCTFCTIPYGRGNNRSVPIAEIVQQVQTLVDAGCKEIVFTGVDITGYGGDLPGNPSLGQMTKRVLTLVPNLPRLRLSSVDPAEIDDDLFALIKSEERLMPHFHLSLQAGADLILKRMKRRHLKQDAIDFCNKVRALRNDVVFGADIIAGFPTETDELFAQTVATLEECNITYMHVFPYSARKGTPAARMPQVASHDIKERAAKLRQLGEKHKLAFFASRVDQETSILMENENKGHTEHFAPVVLIDGAQAQMGEIVRARITGYTDKHLEAKLLEA